MIFVDGTTAYPESACAPAARRYGGEWCHMWCDGDLDELHRMAEALGFRRLYFQDVKGFPHYDLVGSRRARAIGLGAKQTSLREWIRSRKGIEKHSDKLL
jgi:hypothetical protein